MLNVAINFLASHSQWLTTSLMKSLRKKDRLYKKKGKKGVLSMLPPNTAIFLINFYRKQKEVIILIRYLILLIAARNSGKY